MKSKIGNRPAVFLDRDGIINPLIMRDGKRTSPRAQSEWQIFPDVEPSLEMLRNSGFLLLVITNQPEIARGQSDPALVREFHEDLLRRGLVDAVKMCPHDDSDACACRKPRPGLILQYEKEMGVDLSKSVLIGDTWKDIEAGAAAGVQTILVRRPYSGEARPDYEVDGLLEAAELVLSRKLT